MQNDLISRSKLLEALQQNRLYHANTSREESLLIRCENLVKEQPAAYDAERIVEQLEAELKRADEEKQRCGSENPMQFDTAKGYATGISNALDIIRKGGVDNAE